MPRYRLIDQFGTALNFNRITKLLAALLTCLLCARSARAGEYIWWEGEKPAKTNFPPKSPFDRKTFADRADQLSAGNWLSTGGKRGKDTLFVDYNVTVPAAGEYSFWVRKFWTHGPFRWRFDHEDWTICDTSFGMADDTQLKKNVNANWVFLGKVKLSAAVHPLEIEMLAKEGEDTACGFDCFVLTTSTFMPDGKLKPGEKSNLADPGYFPFEPSVDSFSADAMLDLRSLNEETAGQNGFIRRDGDHFVLGDGKPVRFWAVNVGLPNITQDRGSIDYLAKKLAKLGVNMVRFHSAIYDKTDPTRFDAKQLDNLFYLVAALKRNGIYSYLSFYYPLWIDASDPHLGLPGYDKQKNKNPFGLVYFDPHMQEIYRGWARQLLDTTNPYTGTTLAKDPAIGIVEIVNEDSLFFWTFAQKNIPPEKWKELEDQYSQWLIGKYGSLEKARADWPWQRMSQDAADHAGLYDAYGMTHDGVQHFGTRRMADQIRFLAETQHDFYVSTVNFLKNDWHYGGLVNASNWFTVDPVLLSAIDRWTLSAGDMIDQHGYLHPKVTGEGSAYSVRAGDTFDGTASVLTPANIPLRFFRTAGYPQISSEMGWTNPNRYRCDAVFLVAAYGCLQHVDGLFFFTVSSNYLRDTTMTKFGISTPAVAGEFPAAALIYRRGDVQPAEPVINQRVNLEDQLNLKGMPADHDADFGPYVGVMTRTFDDVKYAPPTANPATFIDRNTKTIVSATHQLKWDYGVGIAEMNTPAAQGAAGFLNKAGTIQLDDITIRCSNEFASILVVSMDGKPLKDAKKLLIQAVTQDQPYHFKTEPDGRGGERILDLGQAPLGVKLIDATVTLKNGARPVRITSLDENGYQRGTATASPVSPSGGVQINLSPKTLYQIVER